MNTYINFKYNNIAIVCGLESNLFVLDIDVANDGLRWWQQFCSKHSYAYTNSTTCVLTPSGGIHLYYKYNDTFCANSVRMKKADGSLIGIDVRSSNGCVIAPPSSYEGKGKYQFVCMKRPQEIPIFFHELVQSIIT